MKKLLSLKNTGSIFVIAGLLIIFVIALYTFILQSSYTKTALETEITYNPNISPSLTSNVMS